MMISSNSMGRIGLCFAPNDCVWAASLMLAIVRAIPFWYCRRPLLVANGTQKLEFFSVQYIQGNELASFCKPKSVLRICKTKHSEPIHVNQQTKSIPRHQTKVIHMMPTL